jgi:hypothetical protein
MCTGNAASGHPTGRTQGSDGFIPGSRKFVDPHKEEYMAQLGATLVALLQRRQAAEEEGLLVEVLEIEAALSSLREELAVVAERRRGEAR